MDATTERAAASSLALPEELETEALVIRPLDPIEKAIITFPMLPGPALDLIAGRLAESRANTIDLYSELDRLPPEVLA